MDDRSSRQPQASVRRGPTRKVAAVAVSLGLLLGAMALMEGTGSAQRAPVRTSTAGRQFGPGAGLPTIPVRPTRTVPPVATTARPPVGGDGLAQANRAAAQAMATVQSAAALPPSLLNIICQTILSARVRVVAQINAIEAQFPSLVPQLEAVKAAVVAQINAFLSRFGCGNPSLG